MTKTYFRVQPVGRDILDGPQTSRAWHRSETEAQATDRSGVSVCGSREELAAYLATYGQGIPYGQADWVLVELRGEVSDDQPLDAEGGELLVHPTEIVAVAEIDDAFFQMIGAAYDAAI